MKICIYKVRHQYASQCLTLVIGVKFLILMQGYNLTNMSNGNCVKVQLKWSTF